MPDAAQSGRRRYLARQPATWLTLGAYGVTMLLVIALSFRVGFATNAVVAVWPVSGIAVCAALQFGWLAVLPIALSGVCYSLLSQADEPVLLYALTSTTNGLAVCGAVAVYRLLGGPVALFSSVGAVIRTILILAAGHSAIAGLAGASMVGYRMGLPGSDLWTLGWRWFFSDFTGVMLVLPAATALAPHIWRPQRALQRALTDPDRRTAATATVLIMMGLVGISGLFPGEAAAYPLVLLTMPLCTWLAFRTDTAGSMVLLSTTITVAFIHALMRVDATSGEVFLIVQLYGMVVMCTSLVIHAAASERHKAVLALARERANLEDTVASRTRELREQVAAYEQVKRELEVLVQTDALTGVANRRAFLERGALEVSRHQRTGEPLSVLMVDIDFFKSINDSHGHAAGDEVIVAVAQCLAQHLRTGTDMVARIGGEEFACLLGNTGSTVANATAERLRLAIAALDVTTDTGKELRVTASFGVCSLSENRSDLEGLLLGADDALYAAKRAGRNCVVNLQANVMESG